jgi:hypothetical protein
LSKRDLKFIYKAALWIITPFFLLIAYSAALIVRRNVVPEKPRLVWGSDPIINNSYWSKGMINAGYSSETFTTDYFSINKRDDWDRILSEQYGWAPPPIKPLVAFVDSLFRYDVYIISFKGFFIGNWPFSYLQAQILKLAGKKIIVIPYGGDSYVYRRIRSMGTLHGLMVSYPMQSLDQEKISRDVDYWCANADAVIPWFMGSDGFGRWDVLMPSPLSINLEYWAASDRNNDADGATGTVIITHAPNHRGFKGTEFILKAISNLQAEGLKIELKLLEKISNVEVCRILQKETDILIDQIICTGYAMNALEGLASGLPIISNLEDDNYTMPMRRWSFLGECPIVSASPETLEDVLRKLVTRPELRHLLGSAGRAYAKKYHGLDSGQYLFGNLMDYVYGRCDSLINLYHPLLGEYSNRSPKIEHPLINNRIIN